MVAPCVTAAPFAPQLTPSLPSGGDEGIEARSQAVAAARLLDRSAHDGKSFGKADVRAGERGFANEPGEASGPCLNRMAQDVPKQRP